ncbi:DUF1573 domain-containing protein [Echinicola shivajiensis]|uniref:DUF1573 domain-containing protein n=1 Tax=Echinicola shivajiensis TaxID=1035916 RepID=UPI001BFC683D|nr:DUF1573 domain-containing protein [Echinicola shivajiensis]
MRNIGLTLITLLFFLCLTFVVSAQGLVTNPLMWERNHAELGAVMEEHGQVNTAFYMVNNGESPIIIEEVLTDCGCTTVDFEIDTLYKDDIGAIKVAYQPTSFGGRFEKKVLVKTNINPLGDTLFIAGNNIPYPSNVASYYDYKIGDLGFRFSSINMGNVFTNEPKIKYVDFYNFKDLPITLDHNEMNLPEHVKINMVPAIVPAKSRGLLAIQYDGELKEDLGYFDETVTFNIESNSNEGIDLRLLTTVHEYFAPIAKSEVNEVPHLALAEVNIDLGKISSKNLVSKSVKITNTGRQALNIRKVITNCDCMVYDLPTMDLEPGDQTELKFTFDPKGRLGIDHKMITIFSNDPRTPTRTIIIKSRID